VGYTAPTLHFAVCALISQSYQIIYSASESEAHSTYNIAMHQPITDRYGGGITFSGCPSVSACVRASEVRPIRRITPERVERLWPNLTQIFYPTVRWAD